MEINALSNNSTNYGIGSENMSQKNAFLFNETLNNVKKNSIEPSSNDSDEEKIQIYKSAGMEAISKLPKKNQIDIECVSQHFLNIFHINLFDYFTPDATINFSKIVHDFGDKYISSSDLEQLNKDLDTLRQNKLLTDDEYDSGIRWIAYQLKAKQIILQNKEKIYSTFESMGYNGDNDNPYSIHKQKYNKI